MYELPFRVHWEQWVYQIVTCALIITLIVAAYYYRINNINKKNRQLYELNDRLMIEINERKKAEKKLLASKKRFFQLSQATFEAVFVLDQNKIIEMNHSAAAMFGYTQKEFVGLPINKLVKPLNNEILNDVLLKNIGPLRATGIKKNLSEFFVEFRVKDIEYEKKKYKVIAITDITEKIEADNQKEVLEQQLRQAQKMEAVGNLAGGVAHDFNNMLQIIMGFSEMAVKKIEKDNPVTKDIFEIISTTEKAAQLTRQLMAFSRKQIQQPLVLDINILISNLENILSRLIQSDIIIHKNLQSNIPRIYADPGQIEQVLINLIMNARDAVNERKKDGLKKIEISTSRIITDDHFLMSHIDVEAVDHICIEVKDNGCGIAEEIRHRIYDPFFTTKPEGKGTGLGLSTVYGIIKQNRAVIELDSRLNEGSSFKVFWPATEKTIEKKESEGLAQDQSNGNETILFVEDEEGIRNFAATSLQQKGYKVHTAENGIKALQLIEEDKIEFDLLVSDLNMPGMDGDELIHILNKKIPHLKALIMSGYGDDFMSGNGLHKKNINFLQKPFSIKSLLQNVRSILDRN